MAITLADIEALVVQFEASDWRRIELVADGVELRLSKDGDLPPPRAIAERREAPPVVASDAGAPPAPGGHVVAAPSLGTFYRAPRPGDPPFVTIGQQVAAGQDLCLVEVMKLFTTVPAPVAGTVVAIHASDGELVEYGQPLVSIDPDG